jgi:large subunit ribosomal protein L24
MKKKIPLKIGDKVKIISGFYKEKEGEITKLIRSNGKIIVKGINFKVKHIKPNKQNEVGEIKQIESPIHHSNVKILKN